MRVFDNNITVQRNETFTLDFKVVNKDNSPYIIPLSVSTINESESVNDYEEPVYFVFTVTNSRYQKENRIVLTKWLDASIYLQFVSTRVTIVDDAIESYTLPTGYNTRRSITFYDGRKISYACESVFYSTVDKKYYYYKFSGSGNEGSFVEYTPPRVIVSFSQQETAVFNEQDYEYNILLVSGNPMVTELYARCVKHEIEIPEDYDQISLYKLLYDTDKRYVEDINPEDMIYNYTYVRTILKPTQMKVISNLRGVMR